MSRSPGYSPRHYCLKKTESGNCIPCIEENELKICNDLYNRYKKYQTNGDIEKELIYRIKHHTQCTSKCIDKGHLNYLKKLLLKLKKNSNWAEYSYDVNNLHVGITTLPDMLPYTLSIKMYDIPTLVDIFNLYEPVLPTDDEGYVFQYYRKLIDILPNIIYA